RGRRGGGARTRLTGRHPARVGPVRRTRVAPPLPARTIAKRSKVIPLAGDLFALLQRRADDRRLDCPYVFHREGRRLGDYRKGWAAASAAAGLSGIVPHDLRRSAARNAVRSGVPERVAMELGGWRTRSVFDRYNVTSERDLSDAIERVSRYVAERGA